MQLIKVKNSPKSRSLSSRITKWTVLDIPDSPKLISRKFWEILKFPRCKHENSYKKAFTLLAKLYDEL